jgi:hypothetical protein
MSHSEPTETDADGEGQAQVPEPEVVPRAKGRWYEQSNRPCCQQTEVSR